VRQLWDGKLSPQIEVMEPEVMSAFGEMCGSTLARAHARSGDRIAIASYLGNGPSFDRAIASFAVAYADQNERDHAAVVAAIASGELESAPE
jgi:predicted alpha/beta hydrolase